MAAPASDVLANLRARLASTGDDAVIRQAVDTVATLSSQVAALQVSGKRMWDGRARQRRRGPLLLDVDDLLTTNAQGELAALRDMLSTSESSGGGSATFPQADEWVRDVKHFTSTANQSAPALCPLVDLLLFDGTDDGVAPPPFITSVTTHTGAIDRTVSSRLVAIAFNLLMHRCWLGAQRAVNARRQATVTAFIADVYGDPAAMQARVEGAPVVRSAWRRMAEAFFPDVFPPAVIARASVEVWAADLVASGVFVGSDVNPTTPAQFMDALPVKTRERVHGVAAEVTRLCLWAEVANSRIRLAVPSLHAPARWAGPVTGSGTIDGLPVCPLATRYVKDHHNQLGHEFGEVYIGVWVGMVLCVDACCAVRVCRPQVHGQLPGWFHHG